jgi:hypothetical protein
VFVKRLLVLGVRKLGFVVAVDSESLISSNFWSERHNASSHWRASWSFAVL